MPGPTPQMRLARLLATAAMAAVLALPVAACKTTGPDTTGSIGAPGEPRTDADWRRAADYWGDRYQADGKDPEAAIRFAQALRATDRRAQAAAVLEQAALHHPDDRAVLGAYGRALADIGKFNQALEVLSRAHTPDRPDWRVLNAQGAVLDQLGRAAEARKQYESALKIAPNEPSILSNLGLSYALARDLPRAEAALRRAVDQPGAESKVRQNLGLVVALRGRASEAESIVSAGLPPNEAAAAVDDLRQLIDQRSDLRQAPPRQAIPRQAAPRPPAKRVSGRPLAIVDTDATVR